MLAVFIAGTVVSALWGAGWFLPGWTSWNETTVTADLDGDGADEELALHARAFTIRDGGGVACASPADWRVADAAVGDIDHDGALEVVSLVWKQGSFGKHRPFWVQRDSPAFSQHVFIHRYAGGSLEPVWMSSALGISVAQMELSPEGTLRLTGPDGEQTEWAWSSWGLSLLEEPADAAEAQPAGTGANPNADAGGEASLTLLAVGDNIAHVGIYERAWSPERRVFDFSSVYAQVKDRVSAYDVAVVNQETILVADPAMRSDFPLFGTPQSMGDALAGAGFDVVLGATNHALDQGEVGVSDTLAFWREHHPEVTLLGLHDTPEDAATIDVVEHNGIRLAMFDYTYGLNGRAPEAGREYEVDTLDRMDALLADVRRAEGEADATVCFLHIGEEYADAPTDEQRATVEALVAAGADVVICAHPHVIQPMEELPAPDGQTAIVYWSLGNFVSNQMDPKTVLGAAASLRFERDEAGAVRVVAHEAIPLICHFDEQGTWVGFLDEYTQDQAAAHYLNRDETRFTFDTLQAQWRETMSAPPRTTP